VSQLSLLDNWPVKVLVPVSGGKDSQACLQLAVEHHNPLEVRGLFCDTQFEHPLTYEHIDTMRRLYGVRIDVVSDGSVLEQAQKHGRFPGGGARFCTEELKIWPTKRYCKALAEAQGSRVANKKRRVTGSQAGGFEVWYGMRSDESHERAERYAGKVDADLYEPHEVMSKYPKYLGKLGVRFRLPIVDWSRLDVLELLDGAESPLYRPPYSMDRVGCFPCLASGDQAKEKAFRADSFGRDQLSRVTLVSARIGKSIWTSKSGKKRNEGAGCMVCAI
jgi:3'-phosphoadenosine 5'-phosphosulfate sulfotransferase (PAPS reductase)/FAD synthetase